MNNVVENNKLIASFMGFKIQKDPTERFFGRYFNPIYGWMKENELLYNSDWNWLIEVVQKINLHIDTSSVISKKLDRGLCNANIEIVYYSCIEYIKWYNNQNNQVTHQKIKIG